MAASTAINLTLNAKDWESLIGIIMYNTDPDIQELFFSLQTYYRANGKPQGSTNVTIATTEYTVQRLVDFLYGNTVKNIYRDNGANPLNRIMTAIRAANNIADNYILNALTAYDTAYAATLDAIRKNGRQMILAKQQDGL